MPFDPTLPLDDSLATAGEMRSQLNGLAAMIPSGGGITQHDLDDAIASQTAGPVDGVSQLDPSTDSLSDLVAKVNEMLAHLQRK